MGQRSRNLRCPLRISGGYINNGARYLFLGLLRGNVVSIVHTEEGDHIHVISMRKATKRERDIYFQSIAN
jgi:uncharacterized DUF497 family protein